MNFKAACIQLNSGDDMAENLSVAIALIEKASQAGAVFIALPENAIMMKERGKSYPSFSESEHPALPIFCNLAKKLSIWLLIGSIAVKNGQKLANRSYLISPNGEISSHYDKIHLYDVTLPNGEEYLESERFIAGEKAVIVDFPYGKIGMTICYDVRFPALYRKLAQNGAGIITVPAAFTYLTGKAHWHILLRARAIETGSFVIAPAQCGDHPGNRKTFGHSMIISPWGEIISEASEENPEFIMATINIEDIAKARTAIPAIFFKTIIND